MGIRRIIFSKFENIKNERRTPYQLLNIKFIRFQVVLLFLML
jgi:hypothetical protein